MPVGWMGARSRRRHAATRFAVEGVLEAEDVDAQLARRVLVEDAVREDAVTRSAPEVREAPFHVLQEEMAEFWSYRTDPK